MPLPNPVKKSNPAAVAVAPSPKLGPVIKVPLPATSPDGALGFGAIPPAHASLMVLPAVVAGIVNNLQARLGVVIKRSTVTLVAPERVPAITPIDPVPAEVDFTVTDCPLKLSVPVPATSSIKLGLILRLPPELMMNVLAAPTVKFWSSAIA